MSDWNLEPVTAKAKRRGIIEQRTVQHGKRKKIAKPWVVYRQRISFLQFWPIPVDGSRLVSEYKFATEDQAIRYAEKLRRVFPIPGHPERVWVANNGEQKT